MGATTREANLKWRLVVYWPLRTHDQCSHTGKFILIITMPCIILISLKKKIDIHRT